MAETLGMLCDKLTIVKLKQYHTEDEQRQKSLEIQCEQLKTEIDEYVNNAVCGVIPFQKLTFAANKVFKKEGNLIEAAKGGVGDVFSKLAEINCKLWHEVEKGYDIENVPINEKDQLIKALAILNLERNSCIDKIDILFSEMISKLSTSG